MAAALKLVFSDPEVDVVFINVLGGITRNCQGHFRSKKPDRTYQTHGYKIGGNKRGGGETYSHRDGYPCLRQHGEGS